MNNNRKPHDIDFFRGNKQVDQNDKDNEDYTYSDFKFNKKSKKQNLDLNDIKKVNQNKYNHLDQTNNMSKVYLNKENDILKKPITDKDIEDIQRKSYDDPNIIEGKRKPLKQKNYNFEDEKNDFDNSRNKTNKKNNKPKKEKAKKRNGKKIGLIILIVLFALLSIFAAYLFFIKNTAPAVNVVIIGVDQRKGQSNKEIRADAIMSFSSSIKDNKMIVASIPRDTYAYIPCEEQYDKITHAYIYGAINWDEKNGGNQCTTQAVSQMFDIGTDKFVKVNFNNMVGIIDAIGGIELKSTATFCEQDSKGKRDVYCFKEGKKYNMNGEQALAYSRHRKTDNDIERGLRQQEVVKAMFKSVKNANILQWPGMYTKISSMIETNLTQKEMLQIALVYASNGKMTNFKFNWAPFYSYGVSYVQLDENDIKTFSKKVNSLK